MDDWDERLNESLRKKQNKNIYFEALLDFERKNSYYIPNKKIIAKHILKFVDKYKP